MAVRRIATRDFDAFVFNPVLKRMAFANTWVITILCGATLVLIVFLANYFQGTVGGREDFRLYDDFRTVALFQPASSSSANFPLVRDFASWLLLAAIVVGLFLLHRQGQLMSRCLSRLAANGAIVARDEVKFGTEPGATLDKSKTFRLNWRSRLLRINRILANCTVDNAFDKIVERANEIAIRLRGVFVAFFLIAAVVGFLLLIGTTRGFFVTLSPQFPDDPAGRLQWLDAAYQGWWASTYHPLGTVVYFVCAILAFVIVLSFQPVGLSVLYLVIAMRYTTQWSADWSNADGCYGWRPVAEVYRTVLQAVTLLGVAVSIMLLMLGIQNVAFVLVPVILYTCIAPLFLIVPRVVWRDVAETAKSRRIGELMADISTQQIDNPSKNVAVLATLQEVDRCRNAEISPLRVRKLWTSTGFTALTFPVALTILQLAFPWFVHAPA